MCLGTFLVLHISRDKCNFFQIGYYNLALVYCINSHVIASCQSACDLGIAVETNMKPVVHCSNIALKANARPKLISKSFLLHDFQCLPRIFVVYVRPLLE